MNTTRLIEVKVPGSSANLGPGFDVMGMALNIYTWVSTDGSAEEAPDRHPATVAFREAGGSGPFSVHTEIPMGRGLGFSGSARLAGAMAGYLHQGASEEEALMNGLALAAELEGHSDNAVASALGGVTVVANETVVQLPVKIDAAVLAWIPSTEFGTNKSRDVLPDMIPRADAVTNIGNTALLITALITGDVTLLGQAHSDAIHQSERLAELPDSAAALQAMLSAGAYGAWLSGSGPTIAGFVAAEGADRIAAALPEGGHTKILNIDFEGAKILSS